MNKCYIYSRRWTENGQAYGQQVTVLAPSPEEAHRLLGQDLREEGGPSARSAPDFTMTTVPLDHPQVINSVYTRL